MNRYEKYAPVGSPVARTSHFWNWQDHQVHLARVGELDAPIRVILLHGAGGNAAAMWPYAARLAALGTLVTVPDLPG